MAAKKYPSKEIEACLLFAAHSLEDASFVPLTMEMA
jgi:hypothetical protein